MRMGDWKIKLKPLISMILVLMVNQAVWSAEPPAGNTDEGDRGLASGKKFALLVGIDDYDPYRQSPDDNTVSEDDLKGCVNDVTDIRKLLTDKRYAFRNDDEHIKVLTNRDATRDAIIQTFRSHLIENAKKHPDGIFVFHYSGHGATGVPDYSGEEQDNSDECIVSSDRDAILDDELAGLCKELVDQTNSKANVTLIFDCCHSGTMSRNVSGDRVRQLPAERLALEKIKKREQAKPRQGKGSEFEGQLVPESDRYVSISACASTQEEPETGGERPNGVLTRNLTDLLKDAPRWWTYRYL
ncbi:MAG TPA: caspase family protein, partial [Candidatus Obscuribacterales bacterium]